MSRLDEIFEELKAFEPVPGEHFMFLKQEGFDVQILGKGQISKPMLAVAILNLEARLNDFKLFQGEFDCK